MKQFSHLADPLPGSNREKQLRSSFEISAMLHVIPLLGMEFHHRSVQSARTDARCPRLTRDSD